MDYIDIKSKHYITGQRIANDVYETPYWVIQKSLPHIDFIPNQILEPSAASGKWGNIAREMWPNSYITGVEYRDVPKPDSFDEWHSPQDFLTWDTNKKYPLIIGNFPFSDKVQKITAEDFIRRSYDLLEDKGEIICLLRLAYLEGIHRFNNLWPYIPIKKILVCVNRPDCIGNGNADSAAYATFIIRKNWTESPTIDWIKK